MTAPVKPSQPIHMAARVSPSRLNFMMAQVRQSQPTLTVIARQNPLKIMTIPLQSLDLQEIITVLRRLPSQRMTAITPLQNPLKILTKTEPESSFLLLRFL